MAKRFTDTNKYKKPFIRGLQGAYKIFWDYLYHECDHAGIWIVDFEIAQHYVGKDMPINKEDALKYFNNGEKRIIEVDNKTKWFIPSFIEFQYGILNPENRAHNSVISILSKYGLYKKNKPLVSPSEGAMDKDKDKDMDMELVKSLEIAPEFLSIFLTFLRYKRKRGESYKSPESTLLAYKKLLKFSNNNSIKAIEIVEQSMANNYSGLFELREDKQSKLTREVKIDHYIPKANEIT
jgi:hypothetical protein